jgi:hypothetical protein
MLAYRLTRSFSKTHSNVLSQITLQLQLLEKARGTKGLQIVKNLSKYISLANKQEHTTESTKEVDSAVNDCFELLSTKHMGSKYQTIADVK